MIDWAHAGPPMLAAFLASMVEFVEALTIVLAVGTVRGWKSALVGVCAGVALLAVLVLALGPALQRVPIRDLQLVVGVLLLLFGMRWLRKAILRSAGIISLHDEEAIYAKQRQKLETGGAATERLDGIAVATTFKAVVIEGLEVVFIVIATGAVGNMLVPASIAAAAAGLVVIALGVAIHKPLSRIPENTLKFAVGLILSAFGVFWIGEGLGLSWPAKDVSLLGLFFAFLLTAMAAVAIARRGALPSSTIAAHGGEAS
ncbi:MAG: TMEM165/GDT1 family protein [Chloroflexi bacterium]|nr:TMEM165/GDT1 family protein [Chloroflexota bacterium]